jgi:hypothetical protein
MPCIPGKDSRAAEEAELLIKKAAVSPGRKQRAILKTQPAALSGSRLFL